MQAQSGQCAQVTVYGITWADYIRYVGGAGHAQAESASQRDPCGQDSSAFACAMQSGRLVSPASIVLTAGTQTDPTLSRTPTVDRLQGAAARIANITLSSSPVAMLFGADPDFEWFPVPDTEAGRAGATLGNVGYFLGGAAGIVRSSGSQIARSYQGSAKYPGVDRFRDIMLKKGTIIFGGHPGQTAFYTTASAMRRSGASASLLYDGLQLAKSTRYPMRSNMAMYEVLEDTPAAFGLAIRNADYGAGWLPQVVVPSFEASLRYMGIVPLGP
jgi:hypothetical protein